MESVSLVYSLSSNVYVNENCFTSLFIKCILLVYKLITNDELYLNQFGYNIIHFEEGLEIFLV